MQLDDIRNRLTRTDHEEIEGFFMDLILSIVMGFQMPISDFEGAIKQAKEGEFGYKKMSLKTQQYMDMTYLMALKKTISGMSYQ